MSIEIKTATLDPVRNTYAHTERRFGDKPATRYQEASYDIQSEKYFHYRPLWQPDMELNDPRRTAIVMEDWYAFRDPRQYYYGAYVQQRSKMQDAAESNYAFFEKRNLADQLSDDIKAKVIRFLVPVRHLEHTANLNNLYGTSLGYGTVLTQALLFNGMDRLGIAQYLSRIALLLGHNSSEALTEAKSYWMDDPAWQGMRALCEETTVTKDWFEVFVAQGIVMDCLVYDLVFNQFDQWLVAHGGQDIGMLTEFMRGWHADNSRWADAVLKTAAEESAQNLFLLETWISQWKAKAIAALAPVAKDMLDDAEAIDKAVAVLDKRLAKAGLLK